MLSGFDAPQPNEPTAMPQIEEFSTSRRSGLTAPAAVDGRPSPALETTGDKAMLDIQAVARQPLPRIDVADYIEMGRLVAQWVTEPETRPTDVHDLRRQLSGIAVVPPSIRSFEFAQSTLDHLVLRLPPREMIEEGIERMTDPMADGRYPLPQFYADHYRPGFGPVMTPLDTLLARVGDQTIAQGR
jgi:hypothetical protein